MSLSSGIIKDKSVEAHLEDGSIVSVVGMTLPSTAKDLKIGGKKVEKFVTINYVTNEYKEYPCPK